MKKIRILQVTGGLAVGGIEKLVTSFYQKIDKNKFEMDFLVYGNKVGELEESVLKEGARIFRAPIPSNNYYVFYKSLYQIMIENGPYDIIHTHVLYNSGIVVKAAKKAGIPVIISHSHDNLSNIKSNLKEKLYHRIMQCWLKKYSTKICACSKSAGEYLFGKDEFDKKRNCNKKRN